MPQDKRLTICKAIMNQVHRRAACEMTPVASKNPGSMSDNSSLSASSTVPAAAGNFDVELTFVLPEKLIKNEPVLLGQKFFGMQHRLHPADGRSTLLIVPPLVFTDCLKINKRYRLFDAVVASPAVSGNSAEALTKAATVIKTFRTIYVWHGCLHTLAPPFKRLNTQRSHGSSIETEGSSEQTRKRNRENDDESQLKRQALSMRNPENTMGEAVNTMRQGADVRIQRWVIELPQCENSEFVDTLQSAAGGSGVVTGVAGLCRIKVGHGGLVAGDVWTNSKSFIALLRQNYPHVYKHVLEFKLVTPFTQPIRLVEAHFSK